MSGTVLSRTDRHTQHSSGAARSATALRRTATAPPVSAAPNVAAAPGIPAVDADASDAEPASAPLATALSTTTLSTTALPGAAPPVEAGPAGATAPRSQADDDGTGPADSPAAAAVTVTLAIPLTGEELSPQAYRLLDALRELVELGHGTVTTTAVPGPRAGAHDTLAAREAPPAHDTAATLDSLAAYDISSSGPRIDDTGATYHPDGDRRGGVLTHRFDGTPAARRDDPAAPRPVDPAEVRLLTASRQVLLGGEPLPMTRLEFDLLLFLAGNPRRVFTRAQLLGAVWGYEHTGERTVDVHVRRLRVKMGVQVPLITTVYGVGYRLDDDARIVVVSHA